VLNKIIEKVESTSPAFVVVDSFRAVIRSATPQDRALQRFVHKLAITLTGWQATTFLIGGPLSAHVEDDSVFTVADGVLSLSQSIDRNSMVRKMEVMKMRGHGTIPGLHTFRITDAGIQVFPRLIGGLRESSIEDLPDDTPPEPQRLSIGVPKLDDMLGGGIPRGYSMLVAGPSGSGKSVLASHFVSEGIRVREHAVVAVFERRPTKDRNKLLQYVRDGKATVVYNRPLDLSIDETMYELAEAVYRTKATRVVIDSLSGFELALAPTFREDFRESLYRMVTSLTSSGLTVLLTAELEDRYSDLRFSPHGSAFLTDGIIVQRYVEFDGRLKRLMTVVKVRESGHSKDIRYYEITNEGLVLGERASGYEGLFSGRPHDMSADGQLPVSSPLR
jgi:circadian clock protein KaiC